MSQRCQFQTSILGAGLLGLGAERVRSFATSFPPGWRISLTTMRSGRPVAAMDRWPVLQEQPGVKVCECWHHLPFTKPGTMHLSVIDAWAANLALPRWPPVARQSANESFDCLEHWLLSTRKEPMIIAVELNELSASDLAGHIAACLNTHGPVVPAVQHQRGHRSPWQQVSHVGVAQCLEHGPNAAGTGGRAQEPGPPGPRLRNTGKARRGGVDPGRATPFGDELLAPGVILAGPQRVRMVRRPAALGQ